MRFETTKFKDLIIIKHNVFFDDRGFFKESYKNLLNDKLFISKNGFCQENIVKSKKNVLRGLHYQTGKYAQSKLITVNHGKILDIAVDLRKKSKTYGKYFSYILSSEIHESLFIPKDFAHGYLTLSSEAVIVYKVDNYYSPEMEKRISYNDKFLNIDWGVSEGNLIISKKDKELNDYSW